MDTVAQGVAVVKAVLDYFKTQRFQPDIVLGSEWKPGKTSLRLKFPAIENGGERMV